MKIYKYMGPDTVKQALNKPDICSFKCSYPRDFNDPYELFLTINFQQEPELLATYRDTIGELPQLPTTCFSKSPCVVPMWAHYSHGHRGVVMEVNEQLLSEKYPEVGFGDIDYLDEASNSLSEVLARACHIGKPRYHYFLQRGVFSAAYFTKHSSWSYEQERRLVTREEDVNLCGDIMLFEFPVSCISSLIVGQNASEETKRFTRDICGKIDANYYQIKIGKISPTPYLADSEDVSHLYTIDGVERCEFACSKCAEPLTEGSEDCAWCTIQDHHEFTASKNNPLRMLDQAGGLDDYYESMQRIGRKSRE